MRLLPDFQKFAGVELLFWIENKKGHFCFDALKRYYVDLKQNKETDLYRCGSSYILYIYILQFSGVFWLADSDAKPGPCDTRHPRAVLEASLPSWCLSWGGCMFQIFQGIKRSWIPSESWCRTLEVSNVFQI